MSGLRRGTLGVIAAAAIAGGVTTSSAHARGYCGPVSYVTHLATHGYGMSCQTAWRVVNRCSRRVGSIRHPSRCWVRSVRWECSSWRPPGERFEFAESCTRLWPPSTAGRGKIPAEFVGEQDVSWLAVD